MTDQQFEHIRDLVAAGKTAAAIDFMSAQVDKRAPVYEEMLVLSARFNNLEKAAVQGVLSAEEIERRTNQIHVDILRLLRRKREFKPSAISVAINSGSVGWWRRNAVLAVLLLLFLGGGYFAISKYFSKEQVPGMKPGSADNFIPDSLETTSTSPVFEDSSSQISEEKTTPAITHDRDSVEKKTSPPPDYCVTAAEKISAWVQKVGKNYIHHLSPDYQGGDERIEYSQCSFADGQYRVPFLVEWKARPGALMSVKSFVVEGVLITDAEFRDKRVEQLSFSKTVMDYLLNAPLDKWPDSKKTRILEQLQEIDS